MKNKNLIEQIFRYIDGLDVDKDFFETLEKNPKLLKILIDLSSDISLMNNLKDSKLTKNIKSISNRNFISIEKVEILKNKITDFSYEVKQIFGFQTLELVPSRASKNYQGKGIYIYKNIELSILNKNIFLSIKNIKNKCEIKCDNKILISVSNRKDMEIELESGDYQISVDNYSANIVVK